MLWPTQDPSTDQTAGVQNWHFEKFKVVRLLNGWLAGKPEWLETHHSGKTVPCHSIMTGGELRCPYCIRSRPLAWVAYVPVIEETGKPTVVMVRQHSREILAKLNQFDPIKVSKGVDKFDQVKLLSRPGDRWIPSRENPRPEPDLHPWLLRLWGEQPIIDWVQKVHGVKTVTKAAPQVPAVERPEPAPPELVKRVREGKVTQAMRDAVPGVLKEMTDRITWPGKESMNGVHPPPAD